MMGREGASLGDPSVSSPGGDSIAVGCGPMNQHPRWFLCSGTLDPLGFCPPQPLRSTSSEEIEHSTGDGA